MGGLDRGFVSLTRPGIPQGLQQARLLVRCLKHDPLLGHSPSSFSVVHTAVVSVHVGLCVCLSYGLSLLDCGAVEKTDRLFIVHSWIPEPKPARAHSRCSQTRLQRKEEMTLEQAFKE